MIERMWINQPSTLQPLHHLHGTLVLADEQNRVYFLSGDVISQQVPHGALSKGWPEHLRAAREVAPAEAGDTLHPDAQPFEQYPKLALHIERMAMSGVVGSMISWDAFLRELNAALRAQPPAREDAQPFMFAYEDVDKPGDWRAFRHQIRRIDGSICPGRALYTNPAPDALRVAVSDAMVEAACSRFVSESDDIWSASVWPEGPDDDGDRGDGGRVRLISEADQHNIRSAMRFAMTDALAALQAEQKGGA